MSTSAESPQDGAPGEPGASSPRAATSLLDVLRVGIVALDSDGRIRLWSPTTEEILGWPDSLVLGRPLADFLAPDAGPGSRIYRALLRDGRWRGTLPLRHLDGPTVELEGRVALLRDPDGNPFFLANLVETSRLRAIEQDLAALDSLFASSPLGIAIFDNDRRFVRVNEALSRLHGTRREDLLGKTVLEVLPGHMSQEIYELQRQVLRTGRSVIDLVTLAPDRRGARSISFGRLTDPAGRTLGVSCTIIDITERREALEKIERARQRLSLLDDVGIALGERLDVRRIAQALAEVLVPRFADYSGVQLHGEITHGGELPGRSQLSDTPLLQLGVAAKRHGPAVQRMLRIGQDIAFRPESIFGKVLTTGHSYLVRSQRELLDSTFPGDPKVQAALDLGIHSLMVIPLRARGSILGLLVISRSDERPGFDHEDVALATEISGRASISLDNARLYTREREGALMLQRSLLPQRVPAPPGVQVGYRYVPGSDGTEVGGDWFDVIPLAGGRVAFVVGDVIGHGLRAAATMGRLRTAVRTLAGLDLHPAELLRRVNELGEDLAPGPDEPMMATCVYAVFDPSTRRCAIAKAGHVPPVLLSRGPGHGPWAAAPLEVPDGVPLGVADAEYEETEIPVPEGAVLVLYSDGLIERRGEDITDGLDRLCAVLADTAGPAPSLEDVCDQVLARLSPAAEPGTRDDIALLTAQLGGLPEDSSVSWTFPARGYAVRRARSAVRHALHEWGLDALTDSATLLVSELVTNSLRYAHGPIGVRMVRGASLLIEVSDPLPDPPQARQAAPDDEGGRGLQLVSRESRRWGTRQGAMGKTVWFELPLPGPAPGAP